ncbi:hypothetical protein BDN67DRAFT_985223 [Paxillus ammoniavirescens]|nr:hypothetical protein BDN67DRAFT_985223 [Paxillus ammoniavirescens]
MVEALQEFHATRHTIVETEGQQGASGVKSDFNIPKLELLQNFACNITDNGTLIQYTADVSERLLITHCKLPFKRTSRQASTFTDQIMAILNHDESMRRFDLYHIIQLSDAPLERAVVVEDEEVTVINPALSFIIHVAPEAEHSFKGPHPFHNYFTNLKGFLSSNGAMAFHITVRPDHTGLVVTEMQCKYNVPHMVYYIQDYIIAASRGNPTNLWKLSASKVDIWHKFHIQQHSSFRSQHLMKSQVVQAYLGSEEQPFGAYNAVLLGRPDADGIMVKAIFSPKSREELPLYLAPTPLIYIEYFTVIRHPDDDQDGVGLYRVRHPPTQATDTASKFWAVIPMTEVVHALELIPIFNSKIPDIVPLSATCLEVYQGYYVNSFADKETYHIFR